MTSDNPDTKNIESRWPQDGDRLFVASSWAHDAHVVRDPGERFYRMPIGYKRAGDILVEQAMGDQGDRPDIIYAALFCYRQSIELFLKKVIDHHSDGARKTTHDLSKLWKHFIEIAKDRDRDGSVGLDEVEKLVDEMHKADQKSDGFRYPTDRDNAPFLFGDQGIDLANLREVMQGLTNFFECVELDYKNQDEQVQSFLAEYS